VKRTAPLVITAFFGLLMVFDFFLDIEPLHNLALVSQNGGVIIAAFALGLASVNLLQVHGSNVAKRRPDWIYSGILILALLSTVVLGLTQGASSPSYQYWYESVLTPSSATVYAMTAFYITSAAYRAFRARSLEASLLLVTAAILMLGNAPIGEMIFGGFPAWARWIMNVVNMAGQRGIMIGAGIGAVASGMRTILGIDRSHAGGANLG
jgi:hypothetical protein